MTDPNNFGFDSLLQDLGVPVEIHQNPVVADEPADPEPVVSVTEAVSVTTEEAAAAVAATRFPPDGVRGVAGSTRAAGYGWIKDYLNKANKEICVLVQTETRQALDNLAAVLAAAGSSPSQVVRTTVYLQDLDDFARVNALYAEVFGGGVAPARACVQVAALPKGALVEIDAIATVSG